MIVHLKTLPVAPDNHPAVADTLSTMATLVPAQIDQTRKQIAQLASAPATQAALTATTAALGTSAALAGSVVAELAMSKIEDKVYELTAPTIEGRSAREAIVGSTRQELWLKAEGVDLAAAVNDEVQTGQMESWTADPGMAGSIT